MYNRLHAVKLTKLRMLMYSYSPYIVSYAYYIVGMQATSDYHASTGVRACIATCMHAYMHVDLSGHAVTAI